MQSPDTRSRLLQEAEVLIRTRGYTAFSYADLAERVQIRKASVHHYFPTKEDLIVVLVREYIVRFIAALGDIRSRHTDTGTRLRTYGNLFLAGFEQGMLPLCGALSAERAALPLTMHATVTDFFQIHLDWLVDVLRTGVKAGHLRADVKPAEMAMLLLSTLEGGSFVGWALERKSPVLAAFEAVLRSIETGVDTPKKNPARARATRASTARKR